MPASIPTLLWWKRMGSKLPKFSFALSQATFVAAMAKRNSGGPFAAGVAVQGIKDGTGLDVLSLSRGSLIAGTGFYSNFDSNVGTFVTWWTAEYSSGGIATGLHYFWYASSTYYFAYDYSNARYQLVIGNQTMTVASAVAAGTTYNVASSWHIKVTIDGTNYARVSINDTHTFGITTAPTLAAPGATMYIGSNGTAGAASMLLEGSYLIRRVMYDGSYGTNLGNGDELNLIYAAGVGADPCTIMGSWDGEHCVPTNSTVGALVTGTGEAWSMCHSSNIVTDGWLQSYYGNQWAIDFNGTTTSINCGSDAGLDNLADNAFTAEVWICSDTIGEGSAGRIFDKTGSTTTRGWLFNWSSGNLYCTISCATTNAQSFTATTIYLDSKWNHVAVTFDDAGDRKPYIYIDGVLVTQTQTAGVGAIVADAGDDLFIGNRSDGSRTFDGRIGWCRISNNVRYAAAFKPSRTIPVADANTLAQWAVDEGTGNTLNSTGTIETGAPGAADGTITNGTWQPQWYAEGTPIVPTSVQGSANYLATITADATINDLADNAFTVDGWWRFPRFSAFQYFCHKGDVSTNGWYITVNNGFITPTVRCATTHAFTTTSVRVDDGRWHYFKFTFDDAGDRKPYIYMDNVDISIGQIAGVGAIVSDAAVNGYIGRSTGANSLLGAHGWIRWSNVVRGAGMISRSTPPDPTDANTMLQFNADEGALAVLTDMSGEGNNGAMAGTYSWINTGAMDVDSPGARVYGWGNVYGTVTGTYSGIQETFSGTSVGADYLFQGTAYSEDGMGIPVVQIWDETSNALVTCVSGTSTATEWSPNQTMFSFELPNLAHSGTADCNVYSVQLMNAVPGSVVGRHQAELYPNLLSNPSLDWGFGDPWIPYNWTNVDLDAGDTEKEAVLWHSSAGSMQWNTGAVAAEKITQQITLASGKYFRVGLWSYGDGSAGFKINCVNAVLHSNPALSSIDTPHTAAWTKTASVWRATGANPTIEIEADSGASGARYVDDVYAATLDDVTLTCTPASQANSLEGTGIRVDGLDRLTQPVTSLQAGKGKITFQYTPRHSAAIVALIGNATPTIAMFYADANNYIHLDWSLANTIRLRYNAGGAGVQTGTWTCTGLIVAGTLYNMEIRYTSSGMKLYVDGNPMISISAGVGFSVVPTTAYWGSDNSYVQQNDFVIS